MLKFKINFIKIILSFFQPESTELPSSLPLRASSPGSGAEQQQIGQSSRRNRKNANTHGTGKHHS